MALLALGTSPFLAYCLGGLGQRWTAGRSRARTPESWTRATAVILLVLFAVGAWWVASNSFYRWDRQLHEFGPGVLEAMTPRKASAFVREQKLPGPYFNDWTSGGYLAWDRALPGGVYIYSRGEAQDTQFFSDYLTRLQKPALWHSDADHMGFQTAILFHWWGSHRALLTSLLSDSRWAVVYYDENTAVFVRRAGNDEVIQRALAAFEPLRIRNNQALLRPASSWQWEISQTRSLNAYANVLDAMGKSGDAVRFASRLIEIGGSPQDEAQAAIRLGYYHVGRGEMDRARAYLDLAVEKDPGHPGIPKLRERLSR
jgi:tetratricopeptide (TPR) repeat protein